MGTPTNPMMQQAMGMMSNPAGQTIPTPQQPQGGPHPVIQAIIRALSSGLQGAGYGAMPAQQQVESQQLAAQKAEAMARLAGQQQQLGLEGRRVGIEQQRATTEAKGVEQTGAYQRGELEQSGKRTAIEQQRADIERQRANQSYETEKQRLQQEATRINAEYGSGGLRSQEVASGASRAASEASLAATADARVKLERETSEAAMQRAGLSTDLKAIEDARQREIDGVKEIYGKNPWYERRSTTLDSYNKQLKEINARYDAKISAAEKVAGTGAGAAGVVGGAVKRFKEGQQAVGGVTIERDANGRIIGVR
jgi:hypothetical protein